MLPAIINTIIIVVISLLCSAPIAILGAIYLQEYAKPDSWFVGTINMASETLAGIPSIVYGLFGFIVFVIYVFDNTFTMLAGAFTLSIMVLPLILRNTQEALKCVPETYKEAGFGLGAPKLVVLFRIILPCAVSGVLSGVILSIGRIISERCCAALYIRECGASGGGYGFLDGHLVCICINYLMKGFISIKPPQVRW